MKKIFTLIAALLMVGSMMAKTGDGIASVTSFSSLEDFDNLTFQLDGMVGPDLITSSTSPMVVLTDIEGLIYYAVWSPLAGDTYTYDNGVFTFSSIHELSPVTAPLPAEETQLVLHFTGITTDGDREGFATPALYTPAPAGPIELEFTSSEVEVDVASVIVILSGPDVEVVYETHFDNKSIAGIHNNAMQPYIDVTYNGEWESISEGTAEFTFLNVNESGVYTYKLTLNLVGDSGTEFFGEAEIEIEGDFSNDVTPTALENTAAGVKATKLVENGQVVILRDGKKFNAVGAKL